MTKDTKREREQDTHIHTHTHTHTQTTILRHSGFCAGQPVWAGTRRNIHPPHLSWSSIAPYLLHPSNMIHGILPVQFTCLTVFFHNPFPSFLCLPFGMAPSTSYSIHFFTKSLSSFWSTCPYHHNLFAVVSRLCHLMLVSQPFTGNSIL